jgi:predicted transcriptional regulator
LKDLLNQEPVSVGSGNSLRTAIELMSIENVDVLPVLSRENKNIIGILSYQNILSGYKSGIDEHISSRPHISLKRKGLKLLVHGQKLKRFLNTKD